jgi:hypothetical protein
LYDLRCYLFLITENHIGRRVFIEREGGGLDWSEQELKRSSVWAIVEVRWLAMASLVIKN